MIARRRIRRMSELSGSHDFTTCVFFILEDCSIPFCLGSALGMEKL